MYYNLGKHYYDNLKIFKKAEKYYKLAIQYQDKNDNPNKYKSLNILYKNHSNKFGKAEKYFKLAIKHKKNCS